MLKAHLNRDNVQFVCATFCAAYQPLIGYIITFTHRPVMLAELSDSRAIA
jgi:hypothetical protein